MFAYPAAEQIRDAIDVLRAFLAGEDCAIGALDLDHEKRSAMQQIEQLFKHTRAQDHNERQAQQRTMDIMREALDSLHVHNWSRNDPLERARRCLFRAGDVFPCEALVRAVIMFEAECLFEGSWTQKLKACAVCTVSVAFMLGPVLLRSLHYVDTADGMRLEDQFRVVDHPRQLQPLLDAQRHRDLFHNGVHTPRLLGPLFALM